MFLAGVQRAIPIAGVNHSKPVANEREALISGGNLEDKVAFLAFGSAGTPVQKWHDLAVNVSGPIVKDIYQFFFTHFNSAQVRKATV